MSLRSAKLIKTRRKEEVFLAFLLPLHSNLINMHENPKWTDYRVSLKDRIVEKSLQLFASQGIKAVKMDDIARSLNISKRTLYEVYDNKETLLVEVIQKARTDEEEALSQLAGRSRNVMEMMLNIYYYKTEQMKDTNPQFFIDLEKYPSVMQMLHRNHQKTHDDFIRFVERGVREGYFRSDIDYELVALMLEGFSEQARSKHLFQKYSLQAIFLNHVFVIIRGFCTQKGIGFLDEFMKPTN